MKTISSALIAATVALMLLPGSTPADTSLKPAANMGAPVRLTSAGDNLKPFVALSPTGGVYLSWAQRKAGKTAILFARSQDGVHIETPLVLSDPALQLDLGAEASANVAVDAKGVIYVAWAAGPAPTTTGETPAHSAAKSTGSSASHTDAGHSDHTSHTDAAHSSADHASAGHSGAHGNGHYGDPTDIWIVRSTDDGKSFSKPVQVNDDPPGTVHRFPFVGVDAEGGICVSWLDKRKKTAAGADLTRVFFARSVDGAKTFGKNVDATTGQVYPICHCCRVASVNDPKQGMMIAFRNDVNDLRDMFLVKSTDFGQTFSVPMPLERTKWMISYCPMDGPSLGIDPAGNLHAVWMSGAKTTGKPVFENSEGEAKVLYNRVAPGASTTPVPLVLGAGHHPRLTVGASGEAYILWHDSSSVLLARIGPGEHEMPQRIQIGDEKGISSYPSLALGSSGVLYCAWQESQPDDSVQIYLSRIPVASFSSK